MVYDIMRPATMTPIHSRTDVAPAARGGVSIPGVPAREIIRGTCT